MCDFWAGLLWEKSGCGWTIAPRQGLGGMEEGVTQDCFYLKAKKKITWKKCGENELSKISHV